MHCADAVVYCDVVFDLPCFMFTAGGSVCYMTRVNDDSLRLIVSSPPSSGCLITQLTTQSSIQNTHTPTHARKPLKTNTSCMMQARLLSFRKPAFYPHASAKTVIAEHTNLEELQYCYYIYTFIRHEDRIQHSTEIKTDRQTDIHYN